MKQWIYFVIFSLILVGCGAAQPTPISFDLTATDFSYTPTTFEVKVGQPVTINFDNQGNMIHDFNVSKIPVQTGSVKISGTTVKGGNHAHHSEMANDEVHLALEAKSKGSIEFIPTVEGSYDIFCSVEGHKALGMSGNIVVTN